MEREVDSMAQSQDKPTVDQVLKLVDQLTPQEQDQLLDQLKMDNIRRAIQIGIDQADRGEGIPGEVALAKLRRRAESRIQKSQP